jgi:CheY-like chemotaxis protein
MNEYREKGQGKESAVTKILIIEDDDFVRDVLHQVLSFSGYDVSEASDGIEGIRRFRRDRPDLVVTDLIMPNKDGIETIADLHAEFPGVKIIAMSGGGGQGPRLYLEVAQGFGAARLLTKPFHPDELLRVVQDLL